eukprot:CAMPEP_0176089684 /NCGR_PEP_ID=MMETSP0120_2-20121206/44916_1 /TAXON_ID=160619 /ORGANISM="Kryptoperidinium foliaceum, Strain CCMP 1326" /LENGTH=626 /DNA_ID=CAMNT_0017423565 /DNA_START=45 /DNA_END=1925 /DNA_ORIENTATION=-
MPFAKVGAMPQPTSNKASNSRRKGGFNSSSRQKGITMEDLKRQTALRLAQEQQQKKGYSKDEPSPQTQAQPSIRPSQQPALYSGHGAAPGYSMAPPGPIPAPNAGYSGQTPPFAPHAHNFHQNPPTFVQGNAYPGHMINASMSHSFEQAENRQSSPRSFQQRRQDSDQMQRSQYSSSDFTSGSSDRAVGGTPGKQKLPHGLTVHELKEMTKARLQAEMAEKSDHEGSKDAASDVNVRMSPLDFDSVHDTREITASRDSAVNGHYMNHGPGSTNSIPSMVQVNQQVWDSGYGRQPQVSPLPAVFHSSSSGTGSAFNRPKADTWENISVASHNSNPVSENYGSESVYSGGPTSAYSNPNDLDSLFGQQQGGYGIDDRVYPSSAHTSPSNANRPFDATIGGNRRRAMTHSPRAISIHEDRPILHTDELHMPNFASASRGTLHSRPSRNYSPVLGFSDDDAFLGHAAGLAPLGGTDPARPRTSSAASMPPGSQNALEFNRGRANTFNGFSTAPQGRYDGLTDSISHALTESFLRVSQSGPGLGDNDPGFGDSSAPPGFGSQGLAPGRPGNATSSGWPGMWEDKPQSSSLFSSQGIDDLADNMGSILKLSGINNDRPDRERSNTFPSSNFY